MSTDLHASSLNQQPDEMEERLARVGDVWIGHPGTIWIRVDEVDGDHVVVRHASGVPLTWDAAVFQEWIERHTAHRVPALPAPDLAAARAAGIEECARWHDAEAERMRTRAGGSLKLNEELASEHDGQAFALRGLIATPQPPVERQPDALVRHMVSRFLCWRLPDPWHPDNGISAVRPNYAPNVPWEPTGTNLFDATQAEAMVRHMLEGAPVATPQPDPRDAEIARLRGVLTDARAFVSAELEVRVDSHTLGGDMATLDDDDEGIVGEAMDCLARIDAALATGPVGGEAVQYVRADIDPCLSKREPGEPMFILLARDSVAPDVLECWAEMREREIHIGTWPDTPQEREHVAEVFAKAAAFRGWRKAHRPAPGGGEAGTPKTLWCVRLEGPDDVIAQPSRETAEVYAEQHHAMVKRLIARNPGSEEDGITEASMRAIVEPWPWSADAHAADLVENAPTPQEPTHG